MDQNWKVNFYYHQLCVIFSKKVKEVLVSRPIELLYKDFEVRARNFLFMIELTAYLIEKFLFFCLSLLFVLSFFLWKLLDFRCLFGLYSLDLYICAFIF